MPFDLSQQNGRYVAVIVGVTETSVNSSSHGYTRYVLVPTIVPT